MIIARPHLAALLLIACACANAAAVVRPSSDGWLEVAPAGATCWDGAPWKFWYRPGLEQELVIWFQGGGACWRSDLCDVHGKPTFDAAVTAEDHPGAAAGLFDDGRAGNPIQGWRAVFLPYCTGDDHIGRRSVEYDRGDGSHFRFAHEGQRNSRAALDWIAGRLIAEGEPPPRVLVSGESAGAIAASFWAIEIGDRFPTAQLAVIGAAAGGYRALGVTAPLRQWGVLDALPDAAAYSDPNKVFYETFYVATAERHPTAHLGQVNFANDPVQRRFLDLMGNPTPVLTKGLTCNLNEIRIESPNFHSYIAPGSAHAILSTPAVYTTACEGQRLIDWVGRIVRGQTVENRWCDGSGIALTTVSVPRL